MYLAKTVQWQTKRIVGGRCVVTSSGHRVNKHTHTHTHTHTHRLSPDAIYCWYISSHIVLTSSFFFLTYLFSLVNDVPRAIKPHFRAQCPPTYHSCTIPSDYIPLILPYLVLSPYIHLWWAAFHLISHIFSIISSFQQVAFTVIYMFIVSDASSHMKCCIDNYYVIMIVRERVQYM